MRTLIFLPILGAAIVVSSCSTQLYVSNAVNAPLLKQRGEVQATLTQNDLQVAVGVARHVGIMANGFYRNYLGDNDYRHEGSLGELAVGYFTPLAGNFVFETYAGAGAGRVYKQERFNGPGESTYLASFQARGSRLFIQPNLGFKSKIVDVAFSSRFSFVKYTNFSYTNYTQQQLREDYLDGNRLTYPLFVFAEPAVTLRAGYKFIKFQFQYGLTVNMTSNPIRQAYTFSSLGIVLDIARWYNE